MAAPTETILQQGGSAPFTAPLALTERRLSLFDEALESFGLTDGYIGKNLTIQFDTRFPEPVHKS